MVEHRRAGAAAPRRRGWDDRRAVRRAGRADQGSQRRSDPPADCLDGWPAVSILHEVERLAQKLDADAVDVAEYVHVETLGSIVWDTKRAKLILCPLFPRRY